MIGGWRHDWWQSLTVRYKLHGYRIDAMSRVFGGEPFPFKHVAEMTAAIATGDLHTFAIGIRCSLHRSGNFIVEAWPSTVTAELVFGIVKR